jgi:hypothetical protein
MDWKTVRKYWKKFWYFIWEEDSLLSWLANIALAFVLIKFIVYPAIGLVLATTHPVVAVMSSSMEHGGNFENWWDYDDAICGERLACKQKDFYGLYNISMAEFGGFRFVNGFNTGDIMVITGAKAEKIKIGDVIVYWGDEPVPIIHRVIEISNESGQLYFRTKGDNNPTLNYNEYKIDSRLVIGKAVLRIPYLGWVKIGFVRLLAWIGSIF